MNNHHPLKNQLVMIKRGPLKGMMFHVIDFMVAQHQGKDISRIKSSLLYSVKQRGFPIDSEVVFGKLLPSYGFFCVHDLELQREPDDQGEDIPIKTDGPKVAKTVPENVLPLTGTRKERVRKKKTRDKGVEQ